MKKFLALSSVALGLLAPVFAFAANPGTMGTIGGGTSTFGSLLDTIKDLIGAIIPILIAAAVVFFFWEIIMYIKKEGEEKQKAMKNIGLSLLAIFIMLAFMGIINVIGATTGISVGEDVGSNDLPTIDGF